VKCECREHRTRAGFPCTRTACYIVERRFLLFFTKRIALCDWCYWSEPGDRNVYTKGEDFA